MGSGWWWSKGNFEFHFGPNLGLTLEAETKLNENEALDDDEFITPRGVGKSSTTIGFPNSNISQLFPKVVNFKMVGKVTAFLLCHSLM